MASNSFATGEDRKVLMSIAFLTGIPWTEVPLTVSKMCSYGKLSAETGISTSHLYEIIHDLEIRGEFAIKNQGVRIPANPSAVKQRIKNSRKAQNRRAFVFERDGHKCVYCKSKKHLTLDHLTPRSLGGSDKDRNNLVACCKFCNSNKGALMPANFLFKLHSELAPSTGEGF